MEENPASAGGTDSVSFDKEERSGSVKIDEGEESLKDTSPAFAFGEPNSDWDENNESENVPPSMPAKRPEPAALPAAATTVEGFSTAVLETSLSATLGTVRVAVDLIPPTDTAEGVSSVALKAILSRVLAEAEIPVAVVRIVPAATPEDGVSTVVFAAALPAVPVAVLVAAERTVTEAPAEGVSTAVFVATLFVALAVDFFTAVSVVPAAASTGGVSAVVL
ncbi:MAG: hypothetical protein J1D88_01040 [Treponema sp.]|nr:hypothetical protein [Treponema sp.]